MSNLIGQTLLNQFRVDEFIASGGMGSVYKVWDLKRNVPLAMKVLNADFTDDPNAFKYFQREARALQKLRHPNVVPFYGLFQTDQFTFLLEHYIDGPSLRDVLGKYPKGMSVSEAMAYMQALCAALGYAHASGVVHCDIKPGNVLVDRNSQVYLADFGIARHSLSSTTTIAGAGTPAYMAPEQIRAEQVSPTTDVYALGILLFEMLTKQRPFRGDEPETMQAGNSTGSRISYAHLVLQPPDPAKLNPAIPPALSAVILKALSKSPGDRYLDAHSFYLAAQQAVGLLPAANPASPKIEAYPSAPVLSTVPQKQTHSRINLALVFGGCAFFLLAALIFFAVLINGFVTKNALTEKATQSNMALAETTPVETQLPMPLPVENTSPTLVTPTDMPTEIPSLAPSRKVLYSLGAAEESRELYILDIDTNTSTRIASHNGGINFMSPSPDGSQIVYASRKGSGVGAWDLYILNVSAGSSDFLVENAALPDWCQNPDKPWITYESRNGDDATIWIVDLANRQTRQLTQGGAEYRPKWNPDCTKIIFAEYDVSTLGNLVTYDLSSNTQQQLTSTRDDDVGPVWSPNGQWITFSRRDKDTNSDGVINSNDRTNLYLINPDGSGEQALLYGEYSVFSPSWSTDSAEIVFTAFFGAGDMQINLYSLSSGQTKSLTGRGAYYYTRWMP